MESRFYVVVQVGLKFLLWQSLTQTVKWTYWRFFLSKLGWYWKNSFLLSKEVTFVW